MAIRYNDKEIQVSASLQKVNVDVVYARPEDVIKFDFDLKNVKVVFVDGDVDFILPNGSIISLASYATLAFSYNAPKLYDNEGKSISLENLLSNVQVTKPEDAILILANRDKSQLVQNDEYVNKVIMATVNTGDLQGGNPIAGIGDISIPTNGLVSPIVDKTGTAAVFNQKHGIGDYLINSNTTFLRGTSDAENILPGNTNLVPQPSLTYNFLFGDSGVLGNATTINNRQADYYAIKFGSGDTVDSSTQLHPISMNGLGGTFENKVFDSHSVNGKITRVLKLDYSGGIFPQSIAITGIPGNKDASGNRMFKLWLNTGGTTKLTYFPEDNKYILTQLDLTGKAFLVFEFNDDIVDQNLSIKFSLTYFDPKTSEAKVMETYYDVGIRTISQKSDLSLNSVVINKGASGLVVDADNSGSGDKIFIGGNVANSFSSKSGNNIIFTNGGNDIIDVSGPESKNLIYGSTGYDVITGSGGENNWLIFSNDKSYNRDFLESPVIKDNYYNTLKSGTFLQFYFGVAQDKVSALWSEIGVSASADILKGKETPNFVKAFDSLTVIGNRNNEISITNIVGSHESDFFNLYFQGVKQKVNIFGGNANTVIGSRIIINAQEDDTVTLVIGVADKSSVTSLKSSDTAYIFDTRSFDRFSSNGKENLEVKVVYDGKGGYRSSPVYFTASTHLKDGNKALADFSGLTFNSSNGHIVFDADSRYNSLNYKGVTGKTIDFFYNFTHITGSTGDDIFYGNSNSKSYHFNGFEGNNFLTYQRSAGGVTFNTFDGLIYKINYPSISNIEEFAKYKNMADSYEKVTKVALSNMDSVVVASVAYNIGKDVGSFDLMLGSGNNTLRYDLDPGLLSISVDADSLSVSKVSSVTRNYSGKDMYIKQQERSGHVKYIGAKGDNVFYGGTKYINVFIGNSGNNTLTYEKVSSNVNLSFDLLRGIVSLAGKQDTFENITSIIGGDGDDTISVGNFDPTNANHVKKITGIKIDGRGGVNSFKFSSTLTENLDDSKYVLTFDVDSGNVVFAGKDGNNIEIQLDITKGISSIVGTVGNDKFIASKLNEFNFDGGSYKVSKELQSNGVYGNSLDYSNFDYSLVINLVNKTVVKGNKSDSFRNIQSFVSGTSDDIFILSHSMDDKVRFFNGNSGNNTLTYENNFKATIFDFAQGKVFFADQDVNNIYDIFKNFNIFKGSKGSDIFILSYSAFLFNDKSNQYSILLDGLEGNNTLDFSNWEVNLGSSEKAFLLSKTGTFINNKSDGTQVKYEWKNINSFVGSKFGDYFVISDIDSNFILDGNKDTKEGDNTLDYSRVSESIEINVSTGIVSKNDRLSTDVIKNIHNILLTDKNDTVKFLNVDKGFLTSLRVVDGKGGKNTIDFKQSTNDISASIDLNGFKLNSSSTNISFINFNTIIASKGNSVFYVKDNSEGARVFLNGNIGTLKGKLSVLDLTQLTGNVIYNNINLVDNSKDTSNLGDLRWGNGKKANIVTKDINKVLLNNNDNIIYGSANNNTHYVGGEGNNIIDYSNVEDSIYVYIDNNIQRIRFEFKGGEDKVSNFRSLKGTKNNDTFVVTDLDKISSGIEFDGFQGINTFSFSGSKESIQLDISLNAIHVKDKILTLKNVQHLVLSNHNDTIKISETNVLFNSIDGCSGNNTIDITNGGKVIYNKDNKMELVLSNIPNKVLYFSNFQNIQTTTTTGNQFYGVYGSSMSFKVIGSKNSDVNILSYVNAASLVEIDFTTNTVVKGDKVDYFSGINYFFGSTRSTTFYLAKESIDNFETIYIDVDSSAKLNTTPSGNNRYITYYDTVVDKSGIISLLKLGGDIKFYVSGKTFEGAKVKYVWNNISSINFTNNQTIYASFDESYKYFWRKVDKDIEGTTLVFDTTQGKNGQEYKNGYVVVDSPAHLVSTFDASGQNKAKIEFSIANTIVGTGSSKDIFYAGLDNVNFHGGLNGGKGTLSYKKYTTQDGIIITFASDNSAVITDLNHSYKRDVAKFLSRYEGTSGNDTFIIAQNSGQEVIEIDGIGGVYNKVDFGQLTSGSEGIELDTTKGIPEGSYNYIFKNISTFKLTHNNDTVLGSIGNIGFSKNGKDVASIIIDGGKGENTLDYSVYVKGTVDMQNRMNVDLQMGLISKVGYESGRNVTTNDSIAVVENNQSKINFKNIILSGVYTTNTLIVSGGSNNKSDIYINVAIKNPTVGLKQALSLENVSESLKFTWNGTAVSGTIGGQSVVYDGFNNIRLSNSDSILIIDKPTNMVDSGGALHGGGGHNTLEISNNEANSSVTIDLSLQYLRMNVDGRKNYQYSLFNFTIFNLGYASNSFISTDLGNYTINFIKSNSKSSVNYSPLNGSFIKLVIEDITSAGAQVTLQKLSMSDTNSVVNGTDKVFNTNEIILTNNDDTVDVKNNDSGPEITIDGKKGVNTVSFEKSWVGKVNINSISSGTISLKGYKLINFSKVVLTKGDDSIKLKHDSNLQIDGGGGNNIVDYSEGTFSKNPVLINEYEVVSIDKVRKIAIKVSKEGKYIDDLVRFNTVTLAPNSNSIYTAYFVKQIVNNPTGFNINFNAKDITVVENVMDYSKMYSAVNGIFTNIRFENNVNFAEVWRDKNARSTSLNDKLIGVTKILGTNRGDVFNIDTNVRNLFVNAGNDYNGEINLNYVEEQEGKVFVWDLDSRSINKGVSVKNTKTFLTFRGFKNLGGVFADGKQIDNIFLVYNFDVNYNIVTSAKASSKSIITADYTNVKLSVGLNYDIKFDSNLEGSFNITSYASGDKANTIRLSGVTSILGNLFSSNTFRVTLNKSSDSIRSYLIKGRGNSGGLLDSIEINQASANSEVMYFNVNSGGNLSLNQKGYAKLNIKDVPHIKFTGTASYGLVFAKGLRDVSLSLLADNTTKVSIDFKAISANDYSLTLDKDLFLLRLPSSNINININNLHKIDLNSTSQGQINILSGVDIQTEKVFTNFNSINLAEFGSSNNFKVELGKSTNDIYYTKIGQINFLNNVKKTLNLFLGVKNFSVNITILNFNIIKADIVIFNNISSFANKNVITVRDFHPDMVLQTYDNQVVFNGKNLLTRVLVENTKLFNFSAQPANWFVKLSNSFDYFMAGKLKGDGYVGLGINLNMKSLTLDLTDFTDRKVSLDAIRIFDGHGLLLGLDSVVADWRTSTAYVSIGGKTGLFDNTIIILPRTGVDFIITQGWLMGYIKRTTEKHDISGFTVDGSQSLVNTVNVSFDRDISTNLSGYTFIYNVTRNELNYTSSDYKLVDIIDKKNNVTKGINFTVKNVGGIVGVPNINSRYHFDHLTPIFIEGAKNSITEVILGTGSGKVDFFHSVTNMYITHTSIPNLNRHKSIKIYGNLGGFNSTLDNIHTFDLSRVYNYTDMVFTFDTFPFHASPTYRALLILPEIKGIVQPQNIKNTLNLSPIGLEHGSGMFVLFNKVGKIKLSASSTNSATDYFVAQNVYNIVFPAVQTTFIVDDNNHSYILNGGTYSPLNNTLIYTSRDVFQVNASTGRTTKYVNSKVTAYDYFNYINHLKFDSTITSKYPNFFGIERGKRNLDQHSEDSRVLISFDDIIPDKYVSQVTTISFNDESINLFLGFTGIGKNLSKTVINAESINSLSVTGDGKNHFKVFFVDNSIYYSVSNLTQNFDTSGYFVIVDTNNNNLIYFTAKNVKQFYKVFENFLDGNGTINTVDNYEELMKAIEDKNYHTDKHKPVVPKEDSSTDNLSPENTNHAQESDIEDVELYDHSYDDVNIETLNEDNLTNLDKFWYKQDADWLFNIYNLSINDNTQDEFLDNYSYYALNVKTLQDQESFRSNLDFNPTDIIDVSSDSSIDNLPKEVLSDIVNSSLQSEDDKTAINSTVYDLSSIDNTINSYDTTLLLDTEFSNSDPSTQVINSVNKQNSMNGNNHR